MKKDQPIEDEGNFGKDEEKRPEKKDPFYGEKEDGTVMFDPERVVSDEEAQATYEASISLKKKEEEEAEEAYAAALHERRMHNWELACVATQELTRKAVKAMRTEFKLRVVQVLALIAIVVILLAK